MTLFLATLLWMSSHPVLSEPRAVLPESAQVDGASVVLAAQGYRLQVEPISDATFKDWLREEGVSAKLIEAPALNELIDTLAMFALTIENQGAETLALNLDQLFLRDKEKLVAFQLSRGDIQRSPYGYTEPEIEALSQLFIQESIELGPGQKIRHLVAFKPVHKKLPGKVFFMVNRFYYGIESLTLKCQFRVRYVR